MTRAEVRSLLADYAGANQDFNTRLDLVRAELLRGMTPTDGKVGVLLTIFFDVDGKAIVTLPRQFQSIQAGVIRPANPLFGGFPLRIHNGWYQTIGMQRWFYSVCQTTGFDLVNGGFCVFSEWITPLQLRFTFETSETPAKLLIRGTKNGVSIYTNTSSGWINGEELSFSGSTTVTTTNMFDARSLYIVKPITKGRVTMSTWDGTTATPVAIYEPNETVPRWTRYQVPNITIQTTNQFLAICKVRFTPIANDNDEVIPGNIGALRRGFEALKLADSHDFVREKQEWADARVALIEEKEDVEGAAATGRVQMNDDFGLARIGTDYGWWPGSPYEW